ncbi:MAG: hypothetical protein A2231_12315 [Candidatus Firestonebacteria bacterium RIFOXYA2_FULL_40_8]|nr:MAG: hypothetical protein A2231_12315 [Candidatus Firestonebacteria bacterium RIFOXYA2_FULL_40_8]
MVFTTHIFIFYFLPLMLLIYYNIPFKWRNLFLTVMSYIFYGWWKPWFVLLMFFSTVNDFIAGKFITAPGAGRKQRITALSISVTANLLLLAFFKYYMFSAESLNFLMQLAGKPVFSVLKVALPIGISFYTFQSISYTVDLYRGAAKPARNFIDFACFVSLFPHLIAGPIIRYHTVSEQIAYREYHLPRFSSGVALFILGFAKKIILANTVGDIAAAVFGAANPGTLDAWFGVTAYAFQIYFDFCGYSDMAVGIGRMFGLELIKNFDAPYRSESITELWRRWHISLSTFLRDYLYIPLGGNKKGAARTYVNLGMTMLLGGLWHGAAWNFLVWGSYHGGLLVLERANGKKSLYHNFPRVFRIGITFILMLFSWVLFRAEDLSRAVHYFGSMFGVNTADSAGLLLGGEIYTGKNLFFFAVAFLLVFQPLQAHNWIIKEEHEKLKWALVLLLLFAFSLVVMSTQAFNPFLYFQF